LGKKITHLPLVMKKTIYYFLSRSIFLSYHDSAAARPSHASEPPTGGHLFPGKRA
jgi:hypothetical protein